MSLTDEVTHIILLTPFQLRQAAVVLHKLNVQTHHLIVHRGEAVPLDDILQSLRVSADQVIDIPQVSISMPSILSSPMTEIRRHREAFALLKRHVRTISLGTGHEAIRLVIGSEKDVFTQMLMKRAKRETTSLHIVAVDEGSGYYKKTTTVDVCWRMLYALVARPLFGFPLRYTGTLGTHPDIDEVYARIPERLPYKRNEVSYHSLSEKEKRADWPVPDDKVLLLTSPLNEDSHCSEEEEGALLSAIFSVIRKSRLRIDLKPHPRERLTKYTRFLDEDVVLLDKSISAEDVAYGEYRYIINFGSSILIDLYLVGFPPDRVVTLDMDYSTNYLLKELAQAGPYARLFSPEMPNSLQQFLRS